MIDGPLSYFPASEKRERGRLVPEPEGPYRPNVSSIGGQRKPRLPRAFNGKNEMWEDYLKHFQGVALWNHWFHDDKREALYLALDGSAANYIYSQPKCESATFGELCHMLEARYGAAKSAALDRKALRERRKEKGETYADLGQEILRLARRVYKTAPDLAETEARDFFVRALPPTLRLAVAARDPDNVGDCVDLINKLCVMLDTDEELNEIKKVRRIDNPKENGKAKWADKPKWSDKPKWGGKQKDRRGPGEASQSAGSDDAKSNIWCWDCGKADHRRNKCPDHFKYKPKDWVPRAKSSDQTSVMSDTDSLAASEHEGPKDRGSQ